MAFSTSSLSFIVLGAAVCNGVFGLSATPASAGKNVESYTSRSPTLV